jgi:hypothetical protein
MAGMPAQASVLSMAVPCSISNLILGKVLASYADSVRHAPRYLGLSGEISGRKVAALDVKLDAGHVSFLGFRPEGDSRSGRFRVLFNALLNALTPGRVTREPRTENCDAPISKRLHRRHAPTLDTRGE